MLSSVCITRDSHDVLVLIPYQLLAVPIENTLSQLTQTIRFLVANDMLKDVELKVGQAEEQERERNKIIVVEERSMTQGVDEE